MLSWIIITFFRGTLKWLENLDTPFFLIYDMIYGMVFGEVTLSLSFLLNVVTPFLDVFSVSGCGQSGR